MGEEYNPEFLVVFIISLWEYFNNHTGSLKKISKKNYH